MSGLLPIFKANILPTVNHNTMQTYPNIFILIVLLSGACDFQSRAQVTKISNQELVDLMENEDLQLVDVRTPEEIEAGMIEGAENIDFRNPEFRNNIDKLDKNKPIAVYCGAGGRSGKTGALLQELGFKEIYDLTGGFSLWEAEEFPVATP